MAGQPTFNASASSRVKGLRRRSSSGRFWLCGPWSQREMKAVSAPYCMMSSWMAWSRPVINAATSMITLTPNTTPNTVSALRSLCARSVSIACFRFSPCAWAMSSLVRPQRFNGIELRRAHRGIDPEEESHAGGNAEGQDHSAERRSHGNGCGRAPEGHDAIGQQDSDDAANGGEHRRLGHELEHDVIFSGAQRAANTDFARSFGHAREHDVHDHDAADDQKHSGQRHRDSE